MPNWCYQNLQVQGPHEEINRLKEAITELGEENKETYSLNQLHPCPEDLTNTISGFSGDDGEETARKKQQNQNLETYGYKDWYDWSFDNWGTKWGACDVELQDFGVSLLNTPMSYLNLSFESAWGPAVPLIEKISSQYPKSIFGLSFTEEGDAFAGCVALKGGSIIGEFSVDMESDERPDYDLNDGDDYSEWVQNKVEECDEQLDKFMADFNSTMR